MRETILLAAALRRSLPVRFLGLALCGFGLAACSLSIPMASLKTDDDVTGSIKPSPSPLARELDAEDWRRAKSALATALDPQGNGATVAWDNPASGAKGSFVPLAQPYPKDDGICRIFSAHLVLRGAPERALRSSACRVNGGDWMVGAVMPVDAAKPGTKQSAKLVAKESKNLAERDTGTQLK